MQTSLAGQIRPCVFWLFAALPSLLVIGNWAIVVLIVAGVIAIVGVIVKQAGLVIPQFIVTIFWIVLAIFVGVVAIMFLLSLAHAS